jgi:hypothetical protein
MRADCQDAGVMVLRSASKGYISSLPEPGMKARADKSSQDDATMLRVRLACVMYYSNIFLINLRYHEIAYI